MTVYFEIEEVVRAYTQNNERSPIPGVNDRMAGLHRECISFLHTMHISFSE